MLAAFSIQPVSAQTQELSQEEIQRLIEQVEEISKEDAFLKESQAPSDPHHSHCEISLSTGTGFIVNLRAPSAGLADMSVGEDIFARAAILFRDPRTEIRRSPSGALWGVLKRSGAFVSIVYFRGLLRAPFAPEGIYPIKAVGPSLDQQIQAFLSVPGVFSKDLCSPIEECRLEAGQTLTICTLTVGEPCEKVKDVPDFKQFRGGWENETYDLTNTRIRQAGCLLSAYAAVLKKFGIATDPLQLNDGLEQINGFENGSIKPEAVAQFAEQKLVPIEVPDPVWSPTKAKAIEVMRSALKNGDIPLLTVYSLKTQSDPAKNRSGLHVLVVHKVCGDDFDQIFIQDPGSAPSKLPTLQAYFNAMEANLDKKGVIDRIRVVKRK